MSIENATLKEVLPEAVKSVFALLNSPSNSAEKIQNRIEDEWGQSFVRVKPGVFTMGCNRFYEDERPEHIVGITKPFFLGETPFTHLFWHTLNERFTPDTPPLSNLPKKKAHDLPGFENLPITNFTWNEVNKFVKAINQLTTNGHYRLPTEAEWEYACGAGSNAIFCSGDNVSRASEHIWSFENTKGQVQAVRKKKENAWGLFGMHGNIWEWCEDWFGANYYQNSPLNDPKGPAGGSARVIRGGSCKTTIMECRSSIRGQSKPSRSQPDIGFRLVYIPA